MPLDNSSLRAVLSQALRQAVGKSFVIEDWRRLSGGCINSAYRVQGNGQAYFVKLNEARRVQMFQAEAAGLTELAATDTVAVPKPIGWGCSGEYSFLVLEYLALRRLDDAGMASLGRQLARLHQVTAPVFGWSMDNTIGSTVQLNRSTADWVEFWRRCRLGAQLDLAARQGYPSDLQRQGEWLMEQLAEFFAGYTPVPALLHGDLWSGNIAADAGGRPVVFDPAVYWGDREADLAMTELFGGFSSRFYSAYQEVYPLDAGYRVRRTLYNLYHMLNHLNLFGEAYLSPVRRMLDELVVEPG